MNKEAFVYLWYDSRSKMFYLGKHKGTPDDGYTHSSSIWEHFSSDSVPEGVKRRVLIYGSDKDMYELETKLLLNRKEKCWDRYYNANICGDFYRPSESYTPHTEESKRKISEAHKGKKLTEKTKRKMSKAALGRKHTEETKRKISEAILGRKRTEETKRKMSESRLGKIPWNKGKKYTHNERRT